MFRKYNHCVFLLAAVLLFTACSNTPTGKTAPAAPIARPGQLTPYASPSPTATAMPADPSTPTPLPSPTATPLVHEVKQGEDMMGIALRYGITLEELITANPTVNPRFMSIGTPLTIPASSTPAAPTEPAGPVFGQTPTPIPAETGAITCTRAQDSGVWCFQLARNTQEFPLEGLTAVFRLSGSQPEPVLTQRAFLPLDRLPPGSSLPLAAYFPPQDAAALEGTLQASSELLVSLPSPDDGRYLTSHVENQKVLISTDGLSAVISLDVFLDQRGVEARRIWVAAVAYDASGRVIGARRWEKQGEALLKTGQSAPVQMNLYSVAGEISRVELISELRP